MRLRVNKYSILLGLIIFFNWDCFYLISSSALPIDTDDITLLLEVTFAAYVFYKCGFKKANRYSAWFLIPILIAVTSSFMGYINYSGQPIWYAIRAQRHWIFGLLMYFPMNQLLKSGRYTVEDFIKMLDKLMFIYSIIVIAQYVLGDSVTFLYVTTNERYGTIRLYISVSFLMLSCFWHLERIIKGLKIKFLDIFMLAVPLFILFFVVKSRMRIIAAVGAIVIFLLSMKLTKRKLLYLSLVVVAVCVFLSTSYGEEIIESILGLGSGGTDDTSAIRDVGRAYFMETVFSSPLKFLFGEGFVNREWSAAVRISGLNDGIYVSDNGIFGLIFYYGFFFVFWMIGSFIKIMRDAWKSDSKGMFFFILYGLLGIYSLYPICYESGLAWAIVGAAVECAYQKNICLSVDDVKIADFTEVGDAPDAHAENDISVVVNRQL